MGVYFVLICRAQKKKKKAGQLFLTVGGFKNCYLFEVSLIQDYSSKAQPKKTKMENRPSPLQPLNPNVVKYLNILF